MFAQLSILKIAHTVHYMFILTHTDWSSVWIPNNLNWPLKSASSFAAAGLMHTFNAHAATDITGFGILGHAQTLARQQRSEVSFVIHNLPVLAKMAAVSKACGNMFGLMHGTCPETSGVCIVFVFLLQYAT